MMTPHVHENDPRQLRHKSLIRRLFERRGATIAALTVTVVVGVLGYLQLIPNLLLVTVLTAFALYEFGRRIDQGLPLMQIGAFLACLQWLVGPMISYLSASHHDRYFMYVPEEIYFNYALPGTAIYILGMLGAAGAVRQRVSLHAMNRESFVPIGIALTLVALGAEYAAGTGTEGLAFLWHLLSQLRYVGALYFLLSKHRLRWLLVGLSTMKMLWDSGETGMFHDLILWSSILFSFWFAEKRRDRILKIMVIAGAMCFVTVIQLVKQAMREKLRNDQTTSFSGELINLLSFGSDPYSEGTMTLATARLNQGWIISAVMANVPQFEPFAGGETVKDAVLAATVPRALYADKKKAGGQENFRRFTGLPLGQGTSMGISLLGECYANYGVEGGILALGIMGVLFASSYGFLSRRILKHPTFLLWIPLVYYQAIKTETELVVVMNQVVKGGIVALVGFWICEQFLLRRNQHPLEPVPKPLEN